MTIPNVRKPREYSLNKASIVCEKLCDGGSLTDALSSVDWSFADHFRFIGSNKDYENMVNHALRDRSRQLLERTLEIERQLENLDVAASSTDVAAARTRADILKTVALAYDKNLNPSTNNQDLKEEKGLVAVLQEMEDKYQSSRVGAKTNSESTGSSPREPLRVSTKQSKLTH